MRWVCILLAAAAAAEGPQSGPILQGVLLERDSAGAAGQFSVRAADNQVFRYSFDRKTYVERDRQVYEIQRLEPGERVEVVSEPVDGSRVRRALIVKALGPPVAAHVARRASPAGRYRASKGSEDRRILTANASFSGIVWRLSADRLVLRTREGTDQPVLLRPDTRYLEDGNVVELPSLQPNMRVFVRGSKTLYGEFEAYQVVWGRILQPGSP